jgi:hypothetical protein
MVVNGLREAILVMELLKEMIALHRSIASGVRITVGR